MKSEEMEDNILVLADTHEPDSLETVLRYIGPDYRYVIFSTGDHIPSGMKGVEREFVDKLKQDGVPDVKPYLRERYEKDPEYKKAVDEHYQKVVADMQTRRQVLKDLEMGVLTCAGNQDFSVGKKVQERYGGPDIFKDFNFTFTEPGLEDDWVHTLGLNFVFSPAEFRNEDTAVLMIPHIPKYRKDNDRPFEEYKEEVKPEFPLYFSYAKKVLLLSHQSIDPTQVAGVPEGKTDSFTEPGNRALITHYHELACEKVGAENVQMVHGHHHKPYQQYNFNGSKVHNLDIGDLLLVDPKTGETEVRHVFQRF